MSITVEPVTTRRQLRAFVKLPYRLYRGDPNWVPPLLSDDYKKLDRAKHPFFKHAAGELLLARRDDVPVGRIVALHDEMWEKTYGESAAYWGWFECEHDVEAARALFDAATSWATARGCTRIIGPMSPNANDLIGTLVKGFDGPPVLMMPYNPPYHDEIVAACGNRKWVDLVAWLLDSPEIPERLERIMPKVEARGKFTIRKLRIRDLENEVRRAREVFNEFEKINRVYTPFTDDEFQALVKDMRIAIDPDIVFFAEVDGKVVGASLALPDFNVAFKAAHGRLFPFGIFRLLAARRKIHLIRVLSMGVVKEYRNRGIDLAFYYYSYKYGVPKGYFGAEMSWVEEDNAAMTNTAIKLGGKPYRNYRVYEQAL
jgi:GNAT superfamily N-acetyltransferase